MPYEILQNCIAGNKQGIFLATAIFFMNFDTFAAIKLYTLNIAISFIFFQQEGHSGPESLTCSGQG